MSVITAIFNKTAYSYEDAFNARDCTSDAMRAAIQEWFDLYFNAQPTEDEDPCQRIAYTVVNKLVKTVFGEYTATSADAFVQAALDSLEQKREQAMQMALIGGECLLKPVPTINGWQWTVINRVSVLVFGRDANGQLTDIGLAEYTTADKSYCTLLERRTLDEDGYLSISNKLYRSSLQGSLGMQVPLSTLPRYKDLPESYTFPHKFYSLGVVRVKTPMANCVDGSEDGVSVYAAAVGLIHNINRNEAQLNGEFERGESRIIVSGDLLKKEKDGTRSFRDHIFTALDEDAESIGVTVFSPELRDDSFLNRKREYLRNVETVLGIKRGLLSEVEAVERTAKEVTSSEGDYNLTIIDFQRMWECAVREAIQLCGTMGQLYHVPNAHEVDGDDVTIDWGNGILYDEDKVWDDYKDMVATELLKPEIALGWRFNLPTETSTDLAKIREKYMPGLDQVSKREEKDEV